MHAGLEDGFINGADEVFRVKEGSVEYHQGMDGKGFEAWFVCKLLSNLKTNSVIQRDCDGQRVLQLGQAACLPYEPRAEGGIAVLNSWLTTHAVQWCVKMLKTELLELIANERCLTPGLDMYRTDSIAQQHGHIVLRLPPYHCELSPLHALHLSHDDVEQR